MRQIIFGKTFGTIGNGSGSGGSVYAPLSGVAWSLSNIGDAYYRFRYSQPWSVAGTFRNFYVQMLAPVENAAALSWSATTFILQVNGVDTALSVTVPAAGPVAQNGFQSASSDVINSVSVSPGDRVGIRRAASTITGATNASYANMEWTLTFESDNAGESGYGGGAVGIRINSAAGAQWCAPLNNQLSCFVAVASADTADQTVIHSIVPITGSLYRIDLHMNIAPGAGNSLTFFVWKNNVKQDGSGGTVDTSITISGTADTATALFDLPIAPLDWIAVALDQTLSVGATNNYAEIGAAILATTDGESALCFNGANALSTIDGSTDWISCLGSGFSQSTANSPTPPPSWRPARWPCTELLVSLPGAIDAFTLKGFCVNVNHSPGGGKEFVVVTRKAFTDTASTVTMTGASGATSILNTDPMNEEVDFASVSDRLNIQVIASGTPPTSRFGWTWLMVSADEPPPPIVVTTYQPRWLRRFALPFNQNKWSFISRFELILQAGVGLSGTAATVQGYDPLVMFRLSRDGGQTWDTELTMSMGKLGAYDYRAFINRLGRARNPVVELTGSDPVFVTLLDAVVDIDEGTS